MTILKVKGTLCMLITIGLISIFISSCEKTNPDLFDEEISKSMLINSSIETSNSKNQILLPKEISIENEQTIKDYLNGLSQKQMVEQLNNFTISEYLTQKKSPEAKVEGVFDLKDADISKYLSEKELSNLQGQLIKSNDVESRSRHCCHDLYCYSHSICHIEYGDIDVYELCGEICFE